MDKELSPTHILILGVVLIVAGVVIGGMVGALIELIGIPVLIMGLFRSVKRLARKK